MTRSKKKKLTIALSCVGAVLLLALAFFLTAVVGFGGGYYEKDGTYKHITWKSSVSYSMKHPAFAEYGDFILPWHTGIASATVPWMSYYWMCLTTYWNTADVVDGVNFMIDMEEADRAHFFRYYSEEEIAADPEKEATGLLYLPGDAGKPFAFVVPGGGMTSVAFTGEGFTAARELHAQGYPVFIFKYRVDDKRSRPEKEDRANQDFAAAFRFIFDNAEQLGVSTENYSVWGYSAGGGRCHMWELKNEYGYAAHGFPAPAAVILVYSGYYQERFADGYAADIPPTYFSYTLHDQTIGQEQVDNIGKTIQMYRDMGVTVGVFTCETAPHGYGTGAGTDAAGWMEGAYDFWEAQCRAGA